MSSWTNSDPGICDTGSLTRYGDDLAQIADALDQRARSVNDAISQRPQCWTGDSATAWDNMIRPEASTASTLATTLRTRKEAIDSYITTVRAIAEDTEQNRLNAQRTINLGRSNGIGTSYNEDSCVYTCWIVKLPDIADPQSGAKLEQQRRDTQNALRGHSQELEAIVARRRTADNTLTQALQRSATWAARHKLFTSVGITDPAKMSEHMLISKTGERYAEIAAGSGPFDEDETRFLRDANGAFFDDPAALSEIYSPLGGGDTLRLFYRAEQSLGDGTNPDALALARDLRDDWATATSHWTPEQARAFTAGFVGDLPGAVSIRRSELISFLYNGPTKPGAEVNLALARDLEQWEKTNGKPFVNADADLNRPSILNVDRRHDVSGDPITLDRLTFERTDDTFGLVLEALAGSPRHTQEFLLPDTSDLKKPGQDNRFKSLFQDRDWSASGFIPVAALLEASQAGSDSTPWKRGDRTSLTILAQAITFLAANPRFLPQNVHSAAADHFAGALLANPDSLAAGIINGTVSKPGDYVPDISIVDRPLSGDPTQITVMNVSGEAFQHLFGIIGFHEEGARRLYGWAGGQLREWFDYAAATGDPTAAATAIDDSGKLFGAIQSTSWTEKIQNDEDRAEAQHQVIDNSHRMFSLFTALIPMNMGVGIGVGQATDFAFGAADQDITDNSEAFRLSETLSLHANRAELKLRFLEETNALRPGGGPVGSLPGRPHLHLDSSMTEDQRAERVQDFELETDRWITANTPAIDAWLKSENRDTHNLATMLDNFEKATLPDGTNR